MYSINGYHSYVNKEAAGRGIMYMQRSTSRPVYAYYSHKHFSLLNSSTYFETLAPNIAGKPSTLTLTVCFVVVKYIKVVKVPGFVLF